MPDDRQYGPCIGGRGWAAETFRGGFGPPGPFAVYNEALSMKGSFWLTVLTQLEIRDSLQAGKTSAIVTIGRKASCGE